MARKRFRFRGKLEAGGRGGHVVAIDDALAAQLGVKQHTRVKGKFGGVAYRSSTARRGGVTYLGVHKTTVEQAGAKVGDPVDVMIELDTEPRVIEVPMELEAALRRDRAARAAWIRLAPSHQREYAGYVAEAKRQETRTRRAERTIEALREQAPRRRG